jgi:lysophospholipid acyltransferase
VTQLTFSFVVAPFLILSFSGSVKAWSRVYFYAIIGTAASMAFFASPARQYLKRTLEQRAAKAGVVPVKKEDGSGRRGRGGVVQDAAEVGNRNASTDSSRAPLLGISSDPKGELDDAINEIRAEIEDKRRLAGIQAERVRQRAKGVVS